MTTHAASDTFPVSWNDPADADVTWVFDLAHTPNVATPLGFDLYFGPFLDGFGWARICLQNYYVFDWFQESTFKEAADRIDVAQLATMGRNFWERIVPEVEGYTQYYLSTDFDSLSNDELAQEIAELPALRLRVGHLHTLSLFPHGAGMQMLIEMYKELIADDELEALRLVQGFGNKSTEANRALWQLSRTAAANPAVADRLLRVDNATAIDCLDTLRAEPAAGEFLEALDVFLDDYGWRTDLFELSHPTWAEHPAIPLCQMRAYMERPDYDPDAEQQRLVAEREAAISEAMSKVSAGDAQRLRDVLDMCRHVVSLQEDHNFYLDQRFAFSPRRLVLAAGRRLVSNGVLADANDVFYLSGIELLAALRGELPGAQSIADRTRVEMDRWSKIKPPEWIGAPPPEDEGGPAPRSALQEKKTELSGTGASAGVARGPARVLMSLSEADRFRPGDVLIARTTMPAWTPLFALAAAVVTETGGVLGHAAVVAREYGIPAVLNVKNATQLVRDGQLIEVDGAAGAVRLLG